MVPIFKENKNNRENVSKYGGVPPFDDTINYIKRIKEYMGMDLHTRQTVSGQV